MSCTHRPGQALPGCRYCRAQARLAKLNALVAERGAAGGREAYEAWRLAEDVRAAEATWRRVEAEAAVRAAADLACPHRGGALALVACSCAGGDPSARVQTYQCDLYARCTTDPNRAARDGTKRCQGCDDLLANKARASAVPHVWAVGMTAVPSRLATTVPATLATLAGAGFPAPRVFVDGPDSGGWDALGCPLTFRGENIRPHANWMLGAIELLARHPDATHLLMIEDDVHFGPGLREMLDGFAWPQNAYMNLFVHPDQEGLPPSGWAPAPTPGLGALALAFQRRTLERLLSAPQLLAKLSLPARQSWGAHDGAISSAARSAGIIEHVHAFSLVDHLPGPSTIGNGGERKGVGFTRP